MAKAALTITTLVVLVGCTNATAGQPKSAGSDAPDSPEPTSETSAAPDEPEYSLARLCELISGDEATALGASAEGVVENSASDGHEICTWSDATTLILGYQEGPTTADVKTGPGVTNTPTTVDGLTAVQSLRTEPAELCQILVDLPSGKLFTSSVGVLSKGEGTYDACESANELSNLVIPRVKDL